VFERFSQRPAGTIGVSSITAVKIRFGETKSGSARNQAVLNKFLFPLVVMPFDLEAATHYGMMRAMLDQCGAPHRRPEKPDRGPPS